VRPRMNVQPSNGDHRQQEDRAQPPAHVSKLSGDPRRSRTANAAARYGWPHLLTSEEPVDRKTAASQWVYECATCCLMGQGMPRPECPRQCGGSATLNEERRFRHQFNRAAATARARLPGQTSTR